MLTLRDDFKYEAIPCVHSLNAEKPMKITTEKRIFLDLLLSL